MENWGKNWMKAEDQFGDFSGKSMNLKEMILSQEPKSSNTVFNSFIEI